jgi:hypothetical protein
MLPLDVLGMTLALAMHLSSTLSIFTGCEFSGEHKLLTCALV